MPVHSLGGGSAWGVTTHTKQTISGEKTFDSKTHLKGESIFAGPVEFSPNNLFPTEYEPAGTNLVTNPSFEVDLAGWVVNGVATLARDTTQFAFGAASLSVAIATGANFDGAQSPRNAVVPGDTVSISVSMKASAAKTVRLQHWAVDASGTRLTTGMPAFDVAVTTAWQRFSGAWVMPAGTVACGLVVQNNGTDQGAFTFYVDGAQVERSPVATSYIDGAQGTGFAWTGAAHASTSTRAADTVLRVARDVAGTNHAGNPRFANDLNGWRVYEPSLVTAFARDTLDPYIGEASAAVSVTSATTGSPGIEYRAPAAPGQVWTVTSVVKGDPSGPLLYINGIHFYDSAGTLLGGTAGLPGQRPNTDWTKYVWTSAAAPANTVTVGALVRRVDTDGKATTFKVGFMQMEQASTATSLIDGSLGTGYAWTGTPHASTSTRAANTIIPAVVKMPAPYGLVSEGEGRNLVYNPRFEIDLREWTVGRTTSTAMRMLRSTATSAVGAGALRLETDAVAGATLRRALHTPFRGRPGQKYTLSVWVRGNVNAVMEVLQYTSGGAIAGAGFGNTIVPTNGAWVRYSKSFVMASDRVTLAPEIGIHNDVTTAGFVEFSGVQFEEGDATSYIDGSLGPGYTWEGTPHASPSRRTAGTKVIGRGTASLGQLTLPSIGHAFVGATEGTTSTTYVDLATIGPVVTVNIGPSGRAIVLINCESWVNAAGAQTIISVALSGANTMGPHENHGQHLTHNAATLYTHVAGYVIFENLNPGPTTFTMKYRTGLVAATASFSRRRLAVMPI